MTDRVFMIAFDHVVEFDDVFAAGPAVSDAEVEEIRTAKKVVFRGVQEAIANGLPLKSAAMLIDEKYAADVMPAAREAGIAFAMPVDAPLGGVVLMKDWQDMLAKRSPTWAKPLLWYNVEGDAEKNAFQLEQTKVLQEWLVANGQQMLLEFLIRPEPHQLEAVGGDLDRYRNELLPKLIVAAIEETYAAGIRPALWKIEGVPTPEGTRLIGEAALPTGADCLVLGSGADADTVGRWLSQAAATEGYRGFAVGRTIWQQPVIDWKGDHDDDRLVQQIAERYRSLVDAYLDAPVGVGVVQS